LMLLEGKIFSLKPQNICLCTSARATLIVCTNNEDIGMSSDLCRV
jgi:hypothetical protein